MTNDGNNNNNNSNSNSNSMERVAGSWTVQKIPA